MNTIKETTTLRLIQFYAVWCAPCKALAPIIDNIELKLGSKIIVERIDVESDSNLVIEHEVRSVPTLILLQNEKPVWKHIGTLSDIELSTIIKSTLI